MPAFNLCRMTSVAMVCCLHAACATTATEREPSSSQLDRLRVLAILSEPPDLLPSETARLSALVFEPSAQPAEFAWSWCPVHINADTGVDCPVSESLWQRLWRQTEAEGQPPSYDLGGEPTAQLQPSFQTNSAAQLCQAVNELGDEALPALGICVDGLEANVVLRVRAGGDEEVVLKRVPLLAADTPATARNRNPEALGEVSVQMRASEQELGQGQPLRIAKQYLLNVNLSEDASEPIATGNAAAEGPQPEGGSEADTPRETLVLSWFVSTGEITDLEGEVDDFGPIGGGPQRTVFVPGQSAFDLLGARGWSLLPTEKRSAELVLVLRDGRGGVSYRQESFALEGETP